jgi:hypothetical protein
MIKVKGSFSLRVVECCAVDIVEKRWGKCSRKAIEINRFSTTFGSEASGV